MTHTDAQSVFHVPCRLSVLIPSYCRTDDLVNTVERTLQQDYDSYEIVVIDDGTPGDAIMRAMSDYPMVRCVKLAQNVGLIGARNRGAAMCSGDFILNLDDDSWLEDNDAMTRIVRFMDENPTVGVAALNIGLNDSGYLWRPTQQSAPVRNYIGCGNVYRRAIISKVGGYIEEFYRQGEELERTLRIIDCGYVVVTLPEVRVFHNESKINRNVRRNMAFEAANYLRRELLRAPLILVPLAIFRALRFAIINRRKLDWTAYRQEILGRRAPMIQLIRERRKPVRLSTYFLCLKLRTCDQIFD